MTDGYRDEWGEWHDADLPDLGCSAPHEPGRRPLPPPQTWPSDSPRMTHQDAIEPAPRVETPAPEVAPRLDPSYKVPGAVRRVLARLRK